MYGKPLEIVSTKYTETVWYGLAFMVSRYLNITHPPSLLRSQARAPGLPAHKYIVTAEGERQKQRSGAPIRFFGVSPASKPIQDQSAHRHIIIITQHH